VAILARKELEKRLGFPATEDEGLLITPFVNRSEAWDLESVDLRLGCHFLIPKVTPEPFLLPCSDSRPFPTRIHVPLGDYLVVPAHQTVLGATLEFIKLPFDTSGQILTKSSVARTFVVVETAPWIHPCYRGCLTLEIANVSNTPLLLYPGRPIAQLVLFAVKDAVAPQKLSGRYLGPVYPEAAEFKGPDRDLAVLGVDPDHVWWPGHRHLGGKKTI
jgi:dCTP deaminase